MASDYILNSKGARTGLSVQSVAEDGTYFPVLGICLGFELMISHIGEDISLITPCNKCTDYNAILQFTEEGRNTRLLTKGLNKAQCELLEKEHLSYNYHTYMVEPKLFIKNLKLTEFFNLVSTSPSEDKSFNFISTIEAKRMPFYGFQHHPEWGFYDFYNPKLKVICNDKTKDIGNTIGNFFLSEAKKNKHVYEDKKELEEHIIVNKKIERVDLKGYTYFTNKAMT